MTASPHSPPAWPAAPDIHDLRQAHGLKPDRRLPDSRLTFEQQRARAVLKRIKKCRHHSDLSLTPDDRTPRSSIALPACRLRLTACPLQGLLVHESVWRTRCPHWPWRPTAEGCDRRRLLDAAHALCQADVAVAARRADTASA